MAVGGGLLFGVIVAFGVWKLNPAKNINFNLGNKIASSTTKPNPTNSKTNSPVATNVLDNQSFIKFVRPLPIQTVYTKTLKVTGLTDSEKSWIVLSLPSTDYITTSDDKQTFETDIELESGINQVTASSFSEDGSSSQTQATVIYIPDSTIDTSKLAAGKETTYVGLITDISGSAIDINSTEGNILQISFKADATFGSVKSADAAEMTKITSKEVAIGDTIVATGTRNSSGVLQAERIVVVPAPIKVNIKAFSAKVIGTDIGTISIQLSGQEKTYSLKDSKELKVSRIKEGLSYKAKFTDLKVDQKVILVAKDFNEGSEEILARRIFILP